MKIYTPHCTRDRNIAYAARKHGFRRNSRSHSWGVENTLVTRRTPPSLDVCLDTSCFVSDYDIAPRFHLCQPKIPALLSRQPALLRILPLLVVPPVPCELTGTTTIAGNRLLSQRGAVVLTFNSHNQVRGHRTGSSHSGVEEYPGEQTQANQTWFVYAGYTPISMRDRSIAHSLQRLVSTNSSISQLECILFVQVY